jgi:hypothetical protein
VKKKNILQMSLFCVSCRFKDGHPIRPTQAINFVNQPGGIIGLHIDAVRPEDAGNYTVTVNNKLGDLTGAAKVLVEAREKKPSFQAGLQPSTVVEGFPAKLEVKVIGHPPPTLKWQVLNTSTKY